MSKVQEKEFAEKVLEDYKQNGFVNPEAILEQVREKGLDEATIIFHLIASGTDIIQKTEIENPEDEMEYLKKLLENL